MVPVQFSSLLTVLEKISVKPRLRISASFQVNGVGRCFRIQLNSDLLSEIADSGFESHQSEYRLQIRIRHSVRRDNSPRMLNSEKNCRHSINIKLRWHGKEGINKLGVGRKYMKESQTVK
jgi:hypothetical protein